jgi:hypothetical protein
VRPFGIQCVSEFSALIFLTVVGIQCLSEFSAQLEFSAGTQDYIALKSIIYQTNATCIV